MDNIHIRKRQTLFGIVYDLRVTTLSRPKQPGPMDKTIHFQQQKYSHQSKVSRSY